MAEPPADDSPVGGHNYKINEGSETNVTNACAGCHVGLTTTDRVPLIPVDYDGDGYTSGVQTEVGNLLANVRAELLSRIYGTSWDDHEQKVSIDRNAWADLPFDTRAALYNFNVCSEEKSQGIHNTKYVVAVLQRSYYFIVGRTYAMDYPQAQIIDNFTSARPAMWQFYR